MRIHLCRLVALLIICTTARAAEPPATTAPAAPTAPGVGEVAKDFTLKTIDDHPITLHELTPKSPVVLIVLRGWVGYQCPLCTKQVASFMARKDDLAKANAQVLMVYPGPAERLDLYARAFLKQKLPPNFSFVIDPDFTFTKQYGLRWNAKGESAYPATFVIDPQNKIRFAKVSTSHGGRAAVDEVLKAVAEIK
jgi:thioredoxin-dependent peroxiredoxin